MLNTQLLDNQVIFLLFENLPPDIRFESESRFELAIVYPIESVCDGSLHDPSNTMLYNIYSKLLLLYQCWQEATVPL